MNSSSSIRNFSIVVIILLLSVWLGASLITDQTDTLLKMGAVVLLIICLLLGRKIWLLFIFFYALSFPLIRGFSTAELGMGLLIGFTTLFIMMRRQPLNFKFTELEFWALMVVATVGQVYLRNPVGLNMFGASSVGARPYFELAMAFFAALVLANIVVSPKEIKWAVFLSILGWVASPILYLVSGKLGSIGAGGGADGGLSTPGYAESAYTSQAAGRDGTAVSISLAMSKTLAAYRNPLRDAFHPLWGFLILVSLAFAAASGYRNTVAYVGLFYLIALAYSGGFRSVVIASVIGVLSLVILAITNIAFPLPPNIQRALSPFPGTWEERYVEDSEESTEWRVEMWKEALFTDYWIKNKILGDGLGITRREHDLLAALQYGGGSWRGSSGSGMTAQQEGMMLTGSYHSGPVQCIRVTGYFGLIILLIAMTRTAVHAHRQIMRCKGTEWYPIALFFCIPIIALPIFFTFVFGEFGSDVAQTFISIAIIRLLEKNLPLPPYVVRKHEPYVLLNQRN